MSEYELTIDMLGAKSVGEPELRSMPQRRRVPGWSGLFAG